MMKVEHAQNATSDSSLRMVNAFKLVINAEIGMPHLVIVLPVMTDGSSRMETVFYLTQDANKDKLLLMVHALM